MIILKKLTYSIFIFISLFVFDIVNVNAAEYDTWDLIPIDTVALVETDIFMYNEFYYYLNIDINGYTSIVFCSIENLSNKKMPVSISVGLFNSKKINIGVINYCSLADISSSYSGTELSIDGKSAFSIKIKPDKYNSEDSDLSDVRYISVMEDNKYCKTGGATNFVGLDVEQMKNGITNKQLEINESTKQKQAIIKIAVILLVIVITYMLFGSVVSSLHIKMYGVWTAFSYIPVINNYLSFKMSFGSMFGKVLTGLMTLCFVLGFIGINIFIYVGLIVILISLIVNIIKIVTGKYGMFYYGEADFSNNSVNYGLTDRERMNAASFSFSDSQNIEEESVKVSYPENTNVPVTETSNINVADNSLNTNINNDLGVPVSDSGFNISTTPIVDNDGMIDINQKMTNNTEESSTMQVFDINLNEKQDITYAHTSTEYFDMANADTLSQFESVNNSPENNMTLSEFTALENPNEITQNTPVQNNTGSITDEFSNEITLKNTNQNNNDSSNNQDTDLTRFFS